MVQNVTDTVLGKQLRKRVVGVETESEEETVEVGEVEVKDYPSQAFTFASQSQSENWQSSRGGGKNRKIEWSKLPSKHYLHLSDKIFYFPCPDPEAKVKHYRKSPITHIAWHDISHEFYCDHGNVSSETLPEGNSIYHSKHVRVPYGEFNQIQISHIKEFCGAQDFYLWLNKLTFLNADGDVVLKTGRDAH